MKILRYQIVLPLLLGIVLVFAACELRNPLEQPLDNERVGNQPPETHIFLPDSLWGSVRLDSVFADDSTFVGFDTTYVYDRQTGSDYLEFVPDTTESKKVIHWWGDDPDGEVVAYEYKWNYESQWTLDSAEYDTFYLPIRSAFDQFEFQVRAVDDSGAVDTSPAKLTFPVFNSPPVAEFVLNSNPSGSSSDTTKTFPTRTFLWSAIDPDGSETIVGVEYYLADEVLADTSLPDTITWQSLEADADRVTLRDIEPGLHTFFLRIRDIAGAYSDTIQFPDPGSDSQPGAWLVKGPVGGVCLVNDYPLGGVGDLGEGDVELQYRDWLNQLYGEDGYSIWRIGSNLWHPENKLPYAQEDIEATLSYFDKIIWYQYSGAPHYPDAALGINKYLAGGGNMILTAIEIDTSAVFVHVDTMFTVNPEGRFRGGEEVVSKVDSNLTLTNPSVIGKRMKSLVPGDSNKVHYQLNQEGDPAWVGKPSVGYLDKIGGAEGGKLLFLSVPLHKLNGKDNVPDMLDYYLNTEFEQ
ncbi:MAG: hypothetical protein K9N46_12360 [Candidatus Marinimicrobia bacterium]|nr:hypothetical protein [Candidatus Neomarinimicrobiota bacterium]MCF7829077.1 hypothetical protein [Candidatus Neomarinimicrobiota bacterium]MCF7881524.1 hypothetical protein [Candidatus Neomarinimicrobiota bacterium]